jgi:hypothetical protein
MLLPRSIAACLAFGGNFISFPSGLAARSACALERIQRAMLILLVRSISTALVVHV